MKKRRSAGNSIVEFAVGSTVLVSLFGGALQFGYAFYRYNELQTAVNAGARYAAVRVYDSASATPSTAYSTAVKNTVVYGTPGTGTTSVVPGLTTSNVNVAMTFANGVPGKVTVSISGFRIPAFFSNFTCNNKPSVTYAYQGYYSPY